MNLKSISLRLLPAAFMLLTGCGEGRQPAPIVLWTKDFSFSKTPVESSEFIKGVTTEQWKTIDAIGDPANCERRVAEIKDIKNANTITEELYEKDAGAIQESVKWNRFTVLTSGTYELRKTLFIGNDHKLIGQGEIILLANNVDVGIELDSGSISGLKIMNAGNIGVLLKENSLVHNTVVGNTGVEPNVLNSNGVGIGSNGFNSNATNNCVVSVEVYNGYNDISDGGEGSVTWAGGNADGLSAKYGAYNLTFVDAHAHHNSDDGFDFWKGGDEAPIENDDVAIRIFYSSANHNGKNPLTSNGDGNGFKFGSKDKFQPPKKDRGARLIYGSAACYNKANGFDRNGTTMTIVTNNLDAQSNGKRDYQEVESFSNSPDKDKLKCSMFPIPTPTATAPIPNVISWDKSQEYFGTRTTLCGPVIGTATERDPRGNPSSAHLYIGKPYSDPGRFVVMIWGEIRAEFAGASPENHYLGKNICITGLIKKVKDQQESGIPGIIVENPTQITVGYDVSPTGMLMPKPTAIPTAVPTPRLTATPTPVQGVPLTSASAITSPPPSMEGINTHTKMYGTGADPNIITLGPKVGGHPGWEPYSNKTSMEFELDHGVPVLAPIDMVLVGFKNGSAEYRIRSDGQKKAPYNDLLLYFESVSSDWPGMIIGGYHLLSSPLLLGHNQNPDCSEVEEWGSRMQAQGQMFLPDEDKIMDSTGDALSCDALIGHTVKRGELIGFAGSVGTHSMAAFRFKVSHTSENPTVQEGNRYLHWVQPGSFFYWKCYSPGTNFPSGILAYPFECGGYQLPAEQHDANFKYSSKK